MVNQSRVGEERLNLVVTDSDTRVDLPFVSKTHCVSRGQVGSPINSALNCSKRWDEVLRDYDDLLENGKGSTHVVFMKGLNFSMVLCHSWGEVWRLLLVISVTLKMYPPLARSAATRGQASRPRPRFNPQLVDPLAIVVVDQDTEPLQVLDQEVQYPMELEEDGVIDPFSTVVKGVAKDPLTSEKRPSEAAVEDAANDRVTTMFDDMGVDFNVPIGVVLEELKAKQKEEKLQKTEDDVELKKKRKVEATLAKKMESTKKAKGSVKPSRLSAQLAAKFGTGEAAS
ncbi:hypothetical protein AMTR_s00045p00226780 [Amborella trichopoda]|uniref:Uncharacterized protein n=1 Tax=Amborella trichopoda TaxID=13333 RepID=W1NXB8_AMBTC|nr:hypothetical protein AMTR_s00045p00226780 [Amborella trichopoda]